MASDGRADCTHDRRFYALVLLATFTSLRRGEATALRRCDLDLETATVRIRTAYVERSTGEMLRGPPKSKAGRRIVGIPDAIIPALRAHMSVFVKDEPGALVFPGAMGGPLRRGNFNQMSAWPQTVESIGMSGLHFHDLRHTGNHFAARSGAGLRDLMARMGHDSERAAMIYQKKHEAQGPDKSITDAIDTHVQGEQHKNDDDDDGSAGSWSLRANGTLMAREINNCSAGIRPAAQEALLTCAYAVERVTGIEPALSAWESVPSGPIMRPDLRCGVSASDRERPLVTGVNGPLMARQSWA
jgi:Phage integrase family